MAHEKTDYYEVMTDEFGYDDKYVRGDLVKAADFVYDLDDAVDRNVLRPAYELAGNDNVEVRNLKQERRASRKESEASASEQPSASVRSTSASDKPKS